MCVCTSADATRKKNKIFKSNQKFKEKRGKKSLIRVELNNRPFFEN